ncbi:MAG: hypothetical protein K0S71_1006 [Clostridia bacterium]|nr:hypothetical protein [Clostridia bacterium]
MLTQKMKYGMIVFVGRDKRLIIMICVSGSGVEHLLAKERAAGSNPVSRLLSGCGSVWLERLIWVQEAAGSSPVTPILYF